MKQINKSKVYSYSQVPNKRGGGRKNFQNLINGGVEINGGIGKQNEQWSFL